MPGPFTADLLSFPFEACLFSMAQLVVLAPLPIEGLFHHADHLLGIQPVADGVRMWFRTIHNLFDAPFPKS